MTASAAPTAPRRANPWLVMTIIHGVGLAVTLLLFLTAAVTERVGGLDAHALAAGWAMAGIVLAPLITLGTVLWWYSGRQKEALPARRAARPYDDLPVTATALRRRSATGSHAA